MGIPLASTRASISVRDFDRIIRRFQDNASREARLIVGAEQLRQDIHRVLSPVLTNSLLEHRVMRAILGDNAGQEDGSDLQAEFGLTNRAADRGKDAVLKYAAKDNNIRFLKPKTSSTPQATQIEVGVIYYDKEIISKLIVDPRSSYESVTKTNKFSVEWMSWSLEIRKDLVVESGIKYDLNRNQIARSRSKRALMVGSGKLQWEVPDFVKATPGRGSNWIQEALIDTKALVTRELERELRKALQIKLPQRLAKKLF